MQAAQPYVYYVENKQYSRPSTADALTEPVSAQGRRPILGCASYAVRIPGKIQRHPPMPDNSSQHKQLMETTRRELRQARLELDAMQTDIDNLEIKKVKYQEDIADIQKKRSRLQTELNHLSSESDQRQRRLNKAQQDYASVRTQRDNLQTELNRLETALATRKQDMARTQQDYADAQTERKRLQTEIDSLQTEIDSRQDQLTAVKSEIAQNQKKHPAWMIILLVALGLGHVINIALAGPALVGGFSALGLPFVSASLPAGTPTVLPTQSTGTPAVESTPLSVPRVKADTAIRRGPSDRFEAVATADAGAEIKPVAQSRDGSWVQLSLGLWLPARAVDHLPSLPLAQNIPAPPTSTPTPFPEPRVKANAAVRRGPSDHFEAVATVEAGAAIKPVARSRDGSWVQLSLGLWLPARTVDHLPSLPMARNIPALPVASADPPAPAATIVWATVNNEYGAHLRTGPGRNFDSVRVLKPGARVNPIASNRDGTWVQSDEGWVYAQLLDNVPDSLPVAQDIPTPP